MKTIVAVSDLHGNLPPISPCDILLIAGDICPDYKPLDQLYWLDTSFRQWLEEVPATHVVGVAGNHDLVFQSAPHLIPRELNWIYLEQGVATVEGFKIFGCPWSLPIWGVFQRNELELKAKYAQIPEDTDILISHGPPFGILDRVLEGDNVGSRELLARVSELKKLKLVVFGHIHESSGVQDIFVNAAIVNRRCIPTNYPKIIHL